MIVTLRGDDGDIQHWDLTQIELPAVLGRDSELAQIPILDPQLSRVHCRFLRAGEGFAIEDLSSRNGTWVNGSRVNRAIVQVGDHIRIGNSLLVVAAAPAGPDPLLGSKVGGYEIQELLGRGRYGAVYRGAQIALGRAVAIKVLSEAHARVPERVQSFLTEARRAGALSHPHLVQVHDILQQGGTYMLVMELMAGSVGEVLRDHGPMEEAAVRRILADICLALAFAEQNRLVHRDVKPDNILFGEDGAYKLADLGIAAPMNDAGVAHQERIFGSPHYVAPEQARGGAIDGRADLYALGATAFHLLAGQPVFTGTTREIIAAHLNQPAPDLREVAPQCSPAIADLLARLLRKTPAERPRSAVEVSAMLERMTAGKMPIKRVVPRRRIRRR
jgi:serine/threonine-protein kinase